MREGGGREIWVCVREKSGVSKRERKANQHPDLYLCTPLDVTTNGMSELNGIMTFENTNKHTFVCIEKLLLALVLQV